MNPDTPVTHGTRTRRGMSLRRKLALLLGVLTVGPLLGIAWFDIRTLALLGERLASQAGQALSDQARAALEGQADTYAELLAEERRALETIVTLQAQEVTRALNADDLARSGDRMVRVDDAAEAALPETELHPDKYFRHVEAHRREALPVTFARIGLRLPADAPPAPEAAGLGATLEFMQAVQRHYPDLVYWQYVALESGVHASYPGHAAFPAGFDPRSRHWYVDQRARRRLHWSRPHTDATTRLAMVSVTMPLFAPDGRFIGVTGLDVRLTRLLHKVRLPAHLARDSEVLLGTLTAAEDPDRALEIVARQRQVDTGGDWREHPRIEYLNGDFPGEFASLLRDMRAGGSGFARIHYRGTLTQCVYRHFDAHGTFVMFLVPAAAAAAPAADAARHALEITRRQAGTLVPIAAGVALLTVLAALLGARAVTGPLRQLSDAVEAAAGGRFSTRVDIRSGDELQVLGEHFNRMIPQIEAHARMTEAMAVAREIQQRLLPADPPASALLDIHASCDYADETGGDYFDYLADVTDDASGAKAQSAGQIGIVIADVSGHGIGPALLMATARAFLHASRELATDLAGELGRLNGSLAGRLHAGRFMTMCVLVFDQDARRVQWLSAGHGPAWCWRAATQDVVELAGQDIPLGIDPHWRFAAPGWRPLDPGDIFVLATDGLWEARGQDGTRYGIARLHDCLARHATASASDLCAALRASVLEFQAGHARDDMTLVVVKVRPEVDQRDDAQLPGVPPNGEALPLSPAAG